MSATFEARTPATIEEAALLLQDYHPEVTEALRNGPYAAAPDLLAALHRALAEIEDPHESTRASAIAEIRAAIAKATGATA